MKHSKTFWN